MRLLRSPDKRTRVAAGWRAVTEATGWWRQGPCQERLEGAPRAGTRGLQGGLSDPVGAACGLRNQSSASATRLSPDVTPCGQVGRWLDPRVWTSEEARLKL